VAGIKNASLDAAFQKLHVMGIAVSRNGVYELLWAASDSNLGCALTKETPLYFATLAGHVQIVQTLLEHGVCSSQEDLEEEDRSLRILEAAEEETMSR